MRMNGKLAMAMGAAMLAIDQEKREKAREAVVAPIQNIKQNRLLASERRQPGHILFEVDTQTGEAIPATFKEIFANYTAGNGLKVEVKAGCVYIQALNKKNALKRYRRDHLGTV